MKHPIHSSRYSTMTLTTHRQAYDDDGYVILRGYCNKDHVEQMIERVEQYCRDTATGLPRAMFTMKLPTPVRSRACFTCTCMTRSSIGWRATSG